MFAVVEYRLSEIGSVNLCSFDRNTTFNKIEKEFCSLGLLWKILKFPILPYVVYHSSLSHLPNKIVHALTTKLPNHRVNFIGLAMLSHLHLSHTCVT